MSSTICLNMLARERDTGILHSLASIKQHIDYWVIADLGLSEQTIRNIEAELSDIKGEFVEVGNDSDANIKNALIDYSKQFADYLLLSEADMTFKVEDEGFKQSLNADGYFIKVTMPVQYSELRLIKSTNDWTYYGLACETLLAANAAHENLASLSIVSNKSAALYQQQTLESIESLHLALKANPEDSFSQFHLAKLLMQQGEYQQAISFFDQYLSAEQHWEDQWRWYALYHRGKLLEQLDASDQDIVAAYQAAYQYRTIRAEPLYELARFYRTKKDFAMANVYSSSAYATQRPTTESYDLETAVYEWHIPTEHALSSQKLNKHAIAIDAANRSLKNNTVNYLALNMRESLVASRQISVDAVQAGLAQIKKASAPDDNDKQAHKNRIRLVVPFRNAGEFLRKSIDSIKTQDYDNFTATFIDDCSDDGCADLVPTDDPRFNLIKNNERVGPLVNRMNFILSCDAQDIVFYLDGDDQLASLDTLSYVNQMYNQRDCWLTYGQYISQNGTLGYGIPYANQQQLINDLESGEMRFPMHPITHRAGLFHQIKSFDPEYSCFKEDNGDWLFYASDAVLVRPLFYLAGYQNIHYCNRVLYLYTEGHEISESIDNKQDQLETCRIIGTRLRPPQLKDYRAGL